MLIVSNIRSLFRGLTLNSICKWESEHTETDTHIDGKQANRMRGKRRMDDRTNRQIWQTDKQTNGHKDGQLDVE